MVKQLDMIIYLLRYGHMEMFRRERYNLLTKLFNKIMRYKMSGGGVI